MFTGILSRLFFGLICLMCFNVAFGQSFVSSAGSDVNPCDVATPCRTVNRALAAAGVGGNVMLMDAGPYDPFVINRSARVIAATGTSPRIIATDNSIPAIKVALPPNEFAYLEGLTVNPVTPGGVGINWTMPSKLLWMKNCTVSGFYSGLAVTAGGAILVDTCAFSHGVSLSATGIRLETSSETEPIFAAIQYTEVYDIGNGIIGGSNSDVSIRGCRIWGCNGGIQARAVNADLGGSDNSHAYVTITYSWIYNNSIGAVQDVTFSSATRTMLRLGYNSVYNNSGPAIVGGCDLGANSVFGNGWTWIDAIWSGGSAPACSF
ncbi:MAG TPA: right-handed parallel beta-helix repeat-containing protein [Blastocatellia bacterium]|nr:right-handed parallel beta-helix repeat-containing protein [Blastocatellia bacterium]